MASFNYTTTEGDRIDTLAVKLYGSSRGIAIIADANPSVPLTPIFSLGTVLIIPIIDDTELITNNDLPPWKR